MIQGLIINNKNKLAFLFVSSFVAIVIISIGVSQPTEFIMANRKAVSWFLWIAMYFWAQFVVAVFVGRMIRGKE